MSLRNIYTITLLTLLLANLTASITYGYTTSNSDGNFKFWDAYWSDSTDPTWILTVILEYLGSRPAENVEGVLYLENINGSRSYVEVTIESAVRKGQYVYFDFNVENPLKELSHVTTTLEVRYSIGGEARSEHFNFTITVRGRPRLEILELEGYVESGIRSNVTLVLKNAGGGVARGLEVNIQPQTVNLELIGPSKYRFERLDPGDTALLNITLYPSPQLEDAATLMLNLNYEDDFRGIHSDTITFTFTLRRGPTPVLSYRLTLPMVVRGRENLINLTLTNLGSGWAQNITVKVAASTPSITILGLQYWEFKLLKPNSSCNIPLIIFVSPTSPDVASLTLSIAYESESGVEVVESLSIGLEVVDPPMPRIYYEVSPKTLIRGEVQEVRLELFNSGGEARNITLSIVSGAGLTVLGNTTFFIERIESGGLWYCRLLYYVSSRSEGAVSTTINLNYEDSIGRSYTDSYSFNFIISGESRPLVEVYSMLEEVGQNTIATLPIVAVNRGGVEAVNITLKISADTPYAGILGASYSKVPRLPPGGEVTLNFKLYIERGASGYLPITVQLEYYSEDMRIYQEVYRLGLKIREIREPYLNLYSETKNLRPGVVQDLIIKVENIGGGIATNITLNIQSGIEPLTVISTSTRFIKSLEVAETEEITVPVYIDPTARGGVVLVVNLYYEDVAGRTYSKAVRIGFIVETSSRPIVDVYTQTTKLKPGVEASIPLILFNRGSKPAYSIGLNLRSTSPQLVILNSSIIRVEKLDVGEKEVVLIRVLASEASEGPYTLEATITYYDGENVLYRESQAIGFSRAEVGDPVLNVEPLQDSISSGVENTLEILVRNDGGDIAKNVTVHLISDPRVGSILGSSMFRLKDIPPGGGEVVAFTFKSMPNLYGSISLGVMVGYKDSEGKAYNLRFTLGFKVVGVGEVGVVQSTSIPSPVFPGDERVDIIVTIVNSGNYTLEDVEVDIQQVIGILKPTPGATNTYNIASIPVGEPVQLRFTVDINELAPPGNYKVPVKFVWKNGKTYIYIPLEVVEKAKLEPRIVSPKYISPGEKGVKLVLELFNKSNETLKDVSLEVQSPYITGTTSVYISKLAPKEKRVVTLEVDVSSITPIGSTALDLTLSWTQYGREVSETLTLYLPVVSSEIPEQLKIGGLMIFMGIVAVFIVLYKWRKKF